MITKESLPKLLNLLGFKQNKKVWTLKFPQFDCTVEVDFDAEKIIYPEDKGFKKGRDTTCNFSQPENFVVLECVCRLLAKGYRPEHIELEKGWKLGHETKSGYADICVSDKDGNGTLFIIECKTFGSEYNKELKNIKLDGGQLFSYWQQENECKWLVLYAADLSDNKIIRAVQSIGCEDDKNILLSAEKNKDVLLYKNANKVSEKFETWKETYEQALFDDVIFGENSVAYEIGVPPLRKRDLVDFAEGNKIVNKFEEILRHNNVSDKENAFNRLIALFICKLADEINKGEDDEVEFQYKQGTDTYETLQDRLQRLHKIGMEQFLKEEIFYISDDYAENLVQQYTGQKRKKMIAELQKTLRVLKFYTNNDFAFKDVHNEELFYQNGLIVKEMVQLFEKYRIIGSEDLQKLGDLFEQLLNKGFKQNEGQFFTAMPITRFIWDALPLNNILRNKRGVVYPKIIDYACGAGHFLTQGFDMISKRVEVLSPRKKQDAHWTSEKIYGIEKDYRLSRVSKISMFMHGAGESNIIFGDGLENYPDKGIVAETFDILVANPPYSVEAFKSYLKLKNNTLGNIENITVNGSEIETLFVERIAQLLKPGGIAAVILPSSILNKDGKSFIYAREQLLQNFNIKAIVQLGSKTFGATGTNTVIVFLEKYQEPPKVRDLIDDSVEAIFSKEYEIDEGTDGQYGDKQIYDGYTQHIGVTKEDYEKMIVANDDYNEWSKHPYFGMYYNEFVNSTDYKNKIKGKQFQAKPDYMQAQELSKMFYTLVREAEMEKMRYYAFTYSQKTVVITAPSDNEEQKKFLGYDWSNRKGSEGIKIISLGGKMYNDADSQDETTLAAAIRHNFENTDIQFTEDNQQYGKIVSTVDMLDFGRVDFDKVIKPNVQPKKVLKKGMTAYRLDNTEIFDISIGNRVLASEIQRDGKYPVFSANVFEEFGRIDKQNITDFSMPSVIWGIDGDWMVNVLPEDYPFYPTDHCGVVRIKKSEIVPEYFAIALDIEGQKERFSRTNRASTERIKGLVIPVPPLAEQKKIVAEFAKIDKEIQKSTDIISGTDKAISDKFDEMFGENFKNDGMTSNYPLRSITELCDDGRGRVINKDYVNTHSGDYPVYSSQTTNSGIFGKIDSFDFDGEYVTWTTDGVNAGTVFYRNGKFNCTNVCGTLKAKDGIDINMLYLSVALGKVTHLYVNHVGNDKLMNDSIKKIKIPFPSNALQKEFAEFAQQQNEKKTEAMARKEELLNVRKEILKKHFE